MQSIRVDLSVLREYAQAVAGATQSWLGSLAPEDLERELETPIGKQTLGQLGRRLSSGTSTPTAAKLRR